MILGPRNKTRLPKPTRTGPAGFLSALDTIASQADFKDAGIGVIDFTDDPLNPNVWLPKAPDADTPPTSDKAYRIGSASKIGVMLAAVQLRLDVRRILDLSPQIISAPTDFDEVFRDPNLWTKGFAPQVELQEIADASRAPLISQIFDFTKHPVDFDGPDPDGRAPDKPDADDARQKILDKLSVSHGHQFVPWAKWHHFTFSERLWLTGCLSDNVSATSCLSELGVPYVKAVQRAYGLADHPDGGMFLLASGPYSEIPKSSKPPADPLPRKLTKVEKTSVQDYWWDKATGKYSDQLSWEPGSAAALTAYMIALITNAFADPGNGLLTLPARMRARLDACDTIRNNLADGGSGSIDSELVVDGVAKVPDTTIERQITKVGLLQPEIGAKAYLRCEFVYLETRQDPAPAHGRTNMKYGVVAVVLVSDADSRGHVPTGGHNSAQKSAILGDAVHNALLKL